MRKLGTVLLVLFLLGGLGIFFLSLYSASLVGLRRQLGLVGGDLSQSVDVNRLYRGVVEIGSFPSCQYWSSIKGIPRYIFANEHEKLELGRELANERIGCSIKYLLNGNTERGVYTMLKAMRYELARAHSLEKMIGRDGRVCTMLQSSHFFGFVEIYLETVEGNIRGIIEREYQEIMRINRQNAEACGL